MLTGLGAILAAVCPFIPIPVVRAVCVAVSGVVSVVPVETPAPFDGGIQ
jgi:hypothetical protein